MSRLEFINAYVDQANTSSDLISLLTHIPLSALQTFIKHHVQHSSDISINRMYHDALPMDTILPHDLIQNILSFDHLSIAQRAVSKTFKRLSDKNEAIEWKQREKIIHDPQYEFKIDFQTGTRWAVHSNSQQSDGEEDAINTGGKRQLDLDNALKQCQNRDILLLYDGEHIINSQLLFRIQNHSLSFIGMGDNVILNVVWDSSISHCIRQANMYFRNVHIKTDDTPLNFELTCSHLWMEQCTMPDAFIEILGSSLHLKRCYFDGHGTQLNGCIEIWLHKLQENTVEIIGCTFTNYGSLELSTLLENPVIEIYTCNDGHSIDLTNIAEESIKFVGNIFSNNKGRSIVFTDNNDPDSQERKENHNTLMQSDIVSIHHNIFKNKNGRVNKEYALDEKPNPNQIALGINGY
eukprot:1167092_1